MRSCMLIQTQLKDFDKDILQDLWRVRDSINSIKEIHKKINREESKFLADIEDKSSTFDSLLSVPGLQQQGKLQSQRSEDYEEEAGSTSSTASSPTQSLVYTNLEGKCYRSGTLQLMATAPTHLKKSSDEKLLEDFFGCDHLNKLSIFSSEISLNAEIDGEVEDGGRMMQGLSMPNISNASPSSNLSHNHHKKQAEQLRVLKNNSMRKSRDIASEMEDLWAQLQEKTIDELDEFDHKISPKLLNVGMREIVGETHSNNHARHSSLDGSIPVCPTNSSNLPHQLKRVIKSGHTRQKSLPIDPNYFRQLQKKLSNESTPNLPRRAQSGQEVLSGSAQQLNLRHRINTPPSQYRHVRESSRSSVSSENVGLVSPPMILGNVFKIPTGTREASSPNMLSQGGSSPTSYLFGSSQKRYSLGEREQVNGKHHRCSTGSIGQPHYSTNVIRHVKRNGGEIMTDLPLDDHYPLEQQNRVISDRDTTSFNSEGRQWASVMPRNHEAQQQTYSGASQPEFKYIAQSPPLQKSGRKYLPQLAVSHYEHMDGSVPVSPRFKRSLDRSLSEDILSHKTMLKHKSEIFTDATSSSCQRQENEEKRGRSSSSVVTSVVRAFRLHKKKY